MPTIGDLVEVNFTIQGVTAFQSATGKIVAVNNNQVEISVPFLGGAAPVDAPLSALKLVAPSRWQTTVQIKLQ